MLREPPTLTPSEVRELMTRWLDAHEGLEFIRARMGPGATIEDALKFYRRMGQVGRQPSRVMSEDPCEGDDHGATPGESLE